MLDVLSVLGLDAEELEWQDLALCNGISTNYFYDDYEASESIAKMIDDTCLSCPVMAQCLERGIENNEWGCWGAVYLVSGKPDVNRNAHKTPEIWDIIRKQINEPIL